jgi:hypothetical protein
MGMTRKKVWLDLLENPKHKFKCVKTVCGDPVESKRFIQVKNGNVLWDDNSMFDFTIKNDKSEFELMKKLRKMKFTEAYYFLIHKFEISIYNLKSDITGKEFDPKTTTLEELQGLWTIKGIYE